MGYEGIALRKLCESENGEAEGPDESAYVIAAHHMRCSRTCHIDEGVGICPFASGKETRYKQERLPPSTNLADQRSFLRRAGPLQ